MSTLSEIPYDGQVESAEKMLALWRQVEIDIAESGQSYRAPGALEVEFVDIDKVHRMIDYWTRRVLAKRGYHGRNYADIEGGESEKNLTL